VFPISKKLGMIEWINNTVTLKDFICESFPGGKDSGVKQLLVFHIIIVVQIVIIVKIILFLDILKLLNITVGCLKSLIHQTN
jgi:hypothetical protein